MRKIRASRIVDITHEAKAKIIFTDDDGQQVTEEVAIIVRGISPKVSRGIRESLSEDAGKRHVEMARYLEKTVKSIPQFVDEDDQPVPLTFDFFDAMENTEERPNVKNIFEAVVECYDPKTQPSGASLDGSAPEGSQAPAQ
jgi:hypothetical protein